MASPSEDLQFAVHALLMGDADVQAIVDGRVHDGRPVDGAFPAISFGPGSHVPDDYECIDGRVETLQIDCWTRSKGQRRPCAALVDAVKAALHEVAADLRTHALVRMQVTSTRIMEDPDGSTWHGIVSLEAEIEEA